MMKSPVNRMLLAAAAASSLAAVLAPQAASAITRTCSGGSSCATPALQASSVTRVVRHFVSARGGLFGLPADGSFEVRDVNNGVRVNSGNFRGSASGHTGGLFSQYNLRVSSNAWRARVSGRLSEP